MLVYYSRFNNTRRMLRKLNMNIQSVHIDDYDGSGEYVLITPTYGIGEVPEEVDNFLQKHHKNMIGVISSGNTNWKQRFALAGDKISEQYKVPLLCKYEMSGMKYEIPILRKVIGEIYGIH